MGLAVNWTKEEIDVLTKVYATALPEDLEKIFGRSRFTITAKANALGLKKSKEYLRSVRTRSVVAAVEVREKLVKENKIVKENPNENKRKIASGIVTIVGNVLTHRGFT